MPEPDEPTMVYLAKADFGWDGDDIEGMFSTLEKAQAALQARSEGGSRRKKPVELVWEPIYRTGPRGKKLDIVDYWQAGEHQQYVIEPYVVDP